MGFFKEEEMIPWNYAITIENVNSNKSFTKFVYKISYSNGFIKFRYADGSVDIYSKRYYRITHYEYTRIKRIYICEPLSWEEILKG